MGCETRRDSVRFREGPLTYNTKDRHRAGPRLDVAFLLPPTLRGESRQRRVGGSFRRPGSGNWERTNSGRGCPDPTPKGRDKGLTSPSERVAEDEDSEAGPSFWGPFHSRPRPTTSDRNPQPFVSGPSRTPTGHHRVEVRCVLRDTLSWRRLFGCGDVGRLDGTSTGNRPGSKVGVGGGVRRVSGVEVTSPTSEHPDPLWGSRKSRVTVSTRHKNRRTIGSRGSWVSVPVNVTDTVGSSTLITQRRDGGTPPPCGSSRDSGPRVERA